MKNILTTLAIFSTTTIFSQTLKTFTTTMHPDSLCYLSLTTNKAYTLAQAPDIKTTIDFGLFETKTDKVSVIEWYNLKPDNEKVPAPLTGTTTKIAAISFDLDQFKKCITIADLKRMTGYLTSNSLANFAVLRNSNNYYQRCFIIETVNGKRGLLFLTETGNGYFKVEVKTE